MGGAGRDSLVFDTKLNSRTNVDGLPDFSVRDDTIRLDNFVFSGVEKPGYMSSNAFRVTTTSKLARDAEDRIIYNKKPDIFTTIPIALAERAPSSSLSWIQAYN